MFKTMKKIDGDGKTALDYLQDVEGHDDLKRILARGPEIRNMLFSFNRANQQGAFQEDEQRMPGPPVVAGNIHGDMARHISSFL